MTPEEDLENAKAICDNLGLPEPKESPARLLVSKVYELMQGLMQGKIKDTEINPMLESLIQAELDDAYLKGKHDEFKFEHGDLIAQAKKEAYEQGFNSAQGLGLGKPEDYKKAFAEGKKDGYEQGRWEALNQYADEFAKDLKKHCYEDAAKIADEWRCNDKGTKCFPCDCGSVIPQDEIAVKLREKAGE